MGPAAVFRWRSESITMAWPLLALATNRSPSVQVTCASTFIACSSRAAKTLSYGTIHHHLPIARSNDELNPIMALPAAIENELDGEKEHTALG
jgi:hypothetical protein